MSEIEHLPVPVLLVVVLVVLLLLLLSTMQIYPPSRHQLNCAGQRQPFTWAGSDVSTLTQANEIMLRNAAFP